MNKKYLTYLNLFLILGILGIWGYYIFNKKNYANKLLSNSTTLTEVELDSKLKSSGKTLQHKPITKGFILKNKGSYPLTIYSINPDCSCTVPEWNKNPIPPGDSIEVKLTYNAKNTGYYLKKAIIKSNSSSGDLVIAIQGEVL